MKLPVLWKRRSAPALSLDSLFAQMGYQGNTYSLLNTQTLTQGAQEIGPGLDGLVQAAYQENGVVFACMLVRQLLFSEARFQFRQVRQGRPGDLFGNPDLGVLEHPWPNGTTGDLLGRAMQDADLAGNFYARRVGDRLYRMRPDWVAIVLGSKTGGDPQTALDGEIIGYSYHPGGFASGQTPTALLPEEVAHFAPIPDPLARYRGMSWLTPILRELMADKAATAHKLKFFEQGATPNLVVSLDPTIQLEAFQQWVDAMDERTSGMLNAYRTMYLGAGADVKVVGSDLRQISFKETQGAGETRIAAAAGVPPVIVGLSEGLQAATYSNYELAMRRFTDLTMRPLWRNMAGSLSQIVKVPDGSELWYDDRDIPALAEDQKKAAEIQAQQAASIKTLIDGGYDPDSVVQAVTSGDLSRLVHSGLVSVQLLPPGEASPPEQKALPPGEPAAAPGRSLALVRSHISR